MGLCQPNKHHCRYRIPQLVREGDTMILDHALQLNFNTLQLRQLNACRMYLQVLTISDISTADGNHVLPNIFQGRRTSDRVSTLNWSITRRLMSWVAWKLFLQHISSGTKLEKSLGSWIRIPHQQWSWFYNPIRDVVYHQFSLNNWRQYTKLTPTTSTRHQSHLYSNPCSCQTPPLEHCHPTTVTNEGVIILSAPSSAPISADIPHTMPNFWESSAMPTPLQDTPYFFQ